MDDYIRRLAAIDALELTDWYHQGPSKDMVHGSNSEHQSWYKEEDVFYAIEAVPAADVVPVRHGTWKNADEQPYFRKHYHAKVCSECGKRKDGKWLYCPYCGSKNQDGGKDNA